MQIVLHEFNILMDQKVYLPNVSGMLRAYAESIPEIRKGYQFAPFLFVRGKPDSIVAQWDSPSVLAFSSSMWNHQLNLTLAARARQLFPDALIVFGGPHLPTVIEQFFVECPFVDVAVLGEGEVAFAEVLLVHAKKGDLATVSGIAFRSPATGKGVRTQPGKLVDLNELPSPYLAGYYDDALSSRGGMEYQVILETNRGCPFRCSFCYWGNGEAKVRQFDLERLRREIGWLADKEIPYVFGADANFGMIPRDREIAELFAEAKRSRGWPRKFRVCYGKNAADRVFDTARVLEDNDLSKGVTVSFQSTDPETLIQINRKNIKLEVYRDLLRRYRQAGMRVYTELILGLPGETYESFSRGIEEVFQAGLYDQVGIFLCQVLPNTEMDFEDYRRKHRIETRRLELVETHSVRRSPGEVTEYEDIVVSTRTMPLTDWKRAATLAWMAQTLHGQKLGFFVALYLFQRFGIKYTELFEYLIERGQAANFPIFSREITRYREYLDDLLLGRPQCVFLDEFGEISWQTEEVTFLHLCHNPEMFYAELEELVGQLISRRGIEFCRDELSQVIKYQFARISSLNLGKPESYFFTYNIPQYFDSLLNDGSCELIAKDQEMRVRVIDYGNDPKEFARQVIWFGRRDCRTLEEVTWK